MFWVFAVEMNATAGGALQGFSAEDCFGSSWLLCIGLARRAACGIGVCLKASLKVEEREG